MGDSTYGLRCNQQQGVAHLVRDICGFQAAQHKAPVLICLRRVAESRSESHKTDVSKYGANASIDRSVNIVKSLTKTFALFLMGKTRSPSPFSLKKALFSINQHAHAHARPNGYALALTPCHPRHRRSRFASSWKLGGRLTAAASVRRQWGRSSRSG